MGSPLSRTNRILDQPPSVARWLSCGRGYPLDVRFACPPPRTTAVAGRIWRTWAGLGSLGDRAVWTGNSHCSLVRGRAVTPSARSSRTTKCTWSRPRTDGHLSRGAKAMTTSKTEPRVLEETPDPHGMSAEPSFLPVGSDGPTGAYEPNTPPPAASPNGAYESNGGPGSTANGAYEPNGGPRSTANGAYEPNGGPGGAYEPNTPPHGGVVTPAPTPAPVGVAAGPPDVDVAT